MKNRLVIIGVVGIIVLAGGLFWFIESKKNQETPISPQTSQISVEPTEAQNLKILTWNDPAGFTFQYSEGIKINNHPEDKVNYANLEMTAEGKSGGILILAADSIYKTADEWGSKDRRNSQLGGGGETAVLGGKTARKISFPDDKTTIIGTVDEGILFTIKLTPDEGGYWQKTFEQISSTFKLTPPPTSAPSSGTSSGSSGDIIEEEEIIE